MSAAAMEPDWVARVIAIAGFAVAVLSLGFNIYREWLRGRRLRVVLSEAGAGPNRLLVVEVRNEGNTPVTVTDWGFIRGGLKETFVYKPPDTGGDGPSLPKTLEGSEVLPPMSHPAASVAAAAKARSLGAVKVRGFVDHSGGDKRKRSKRRRAIRLDS